MAGATQEKIAALVVACVCGRVVAGLRRGVCIQQLD